MLAAEGRHLGHHLESTDLRGVSEGLMNKSTKTRADQDFCRGSNFEFRADKSMFVSFCIALRATVFCCSWK